MEYPAGSQRVEYSIPKTVTTINQYAFYHSVKLQTVTMLENLETIGNYAFYNSSALTTVQKD